MSLYSSCKQAFRRIGVMFRDHELRLQELEKRTVSLYPIVKFDTGNYGKTFPDQAVYRLDGTMAYKLVFRPWEPAASDIPSGVGALNFRHTIAYIDVYIYGLNGTTVVDNYTLKMDSDSGSGTDTHGLINGSSFY